MPSTASLLAFTVVALVLILIPGPSVLFVVSRAVAIGRAAAVRTALGNAIGAFVLVVAIAFGLGALIATATVSYQLIRLVGAVYLVYLGIQAIRHRRELAIPDARPSTRRVLAEGFVVGLTNPKTAVFFAAVLPQFIDPAQPATPQLLLLGAIFVAIAAACDSLWGLLAGTARTWFAGSPQRLRRLSATGGGVMIALGARLAISD
ncbi:MAG TPA: LysE family translocator [Propionicimonas sp.]|nr:LysE family translocator [Propionicimonas sp.]HRA05909.1 LysE family translocator [Propionicimonas sp.]